VARDGGALVLVDDQIRDLGHLGIVSYGISFRRPAPGSAVVNSRISGNYFGIFLSHAVGVRIVGNTIERSRIYGIDPYGESSNVVIEHNAVLNSGLHGIVLADRVHDIVVRDNVIRNPRVHGIVLFSHVSHSTVERNRVFGAFDGIVLTDSSGNLIARNAVVSPKRFGIRLNGPARRNEVTGNTIIGALLALYVYGGASGNSFLDNTFRADSENVRIRADTVKNAVSPHPSRSELP